MDKATKRARIEALRSDALRIVKEVGSWTQVRVGDRDCALKGAEIGDVKILLRTPFQPLPPASQFLRYQDAVLGSKENLPYALDIWFARKKVLNVEWNDGGFIQIVSYRPGAWEGQLLSLAGGDA
jgi:hypothetical protein